ncbi:MAG: ATP synthase F1 subunit delta [Bacteroidetes bacterium]|nr:ATP synthase F1 subunit delta [Bacteroidota bacterium]
MQNPRLAGRYAKSLIDLSREKNQLDLIYGDIVQLQKLCKESRELLNLLRSPIIKADKKNAILKEALIGKLNPLTAAFVQLMVSKGRESALPDIAEAFIEQYNKINGIQKVRLITATPVSEDLKSAITQQLKSANSFDKIDLETSVNELLIGGFQLEFDGKQVDASIARDLRDIKKQFQQNIYISTIN